MKPKFALLLPAFMAIFLSTSAVAENSGSSGSNATASPITSELEMLKDKAHKGDAGAQYELGFMFEWGNDAPKDLTSAAEWYEKAAAQGHAGGQRQLGMMYATGRGVAKDNAKAANWLEKAAIQGDATAQGLLSLLYEEGLGVPKDTAKAFEWGQKAAELGNAPAQFNLGVRYAAGIGVPKDETQAVEWYLKAAAQGFAPAQHNLAGMYLHGRGVSVDVVRAYAWSTLAVAQLQDDDTTLLLAMTDLVLSPAQRAEGQRLASNWKKGDTFETVRDAENSEASQKNKNGTADWKSVYKTAEGESFIDTNSIRKIDGLTYIWSLGQTKVITVLTNDVINCNNHTLANVSGIIKDRSGAVKGSIDHDVKEWEFRMMPPDSPGDRLINFACSTNAITPSGGSATSTGSGFVVSASGYLLTNHHVSDGCSNLKIRDSSKIEHDVTVVATDARNDLALLKMIKPVPLPAATFRANGSVEAGQNVVALGYPLAGILASEVNVSFGYVSATAGLADDTSMLQISAPVQPGNSGGPLLDQSGKLIGVVVAKLDAIKVAKAIGDIPQNINFAVKGEVAQVFLKAHKVKFKTAATTKKLKNTDIASRGRAFTVLVECYK